MQENKSKDEIAELDKDALIVDETEAGNKVFDVIEYIELTAKTGKDSAIAQKILKLKVVCLFYLLGLAVQQLDYLNLELIEISSAKQNSGTFKSIKMVIKNKRLISRVINLANKFTGEKIEEDKWEDLDTDYPTRHILSFAKVFEVSAVTFPAYEQTSIQARGLSDALDSARTSLDSAKAEVKRVDDQKKKIKLLCEI